MTKGVTQLIVFIHTHMCLIHTHKHHIHTHKCHIHTDWNLNTNLSESQEHPLALFLTFWRHGTNAEFFKIILCCFQFIQSQSIVQIMMPWRWLVWVDVFPQLLVVHVDVRCPRNLLLRKTHSLLPHNKSNLHSSPSICLISIEFLSDIYWTHPISYHPKMRPR